MCIYSVLLKIISQVQLRQSQSLLMETGRGRESTLAPFSNLWILILSNIFILGIDVHSFWGPFRRNKSVKIGSFLYLPSKYRRKERPQNFVQYICRKNPLEIFVCWTTQGQTQWVEFCTEQNYSFRTGNS